MKKLPRSLLLKHTRISLVLHDGEQEHRIPYRFRAGFRPAGLESDTLPTGR